MWLVHLPPGRLTRVVAASAPGKSTAGNRPQGWRRKGRQLRQRVRRRLAGAPAAACRSRA
ncbi:hypothetical protein OSK29_23385 [Escherichia coli]|nr:hypothetical protein [Escherichia coli]